MARLLELETLPLRVTARGEWLHGDVPLHPRVAALFMRSVVPRPDGTYVIRLGREEQPLEVADTPWFVRRIDLDAGGESGATIHLSDGAVERLAPDSLAQAEDNALYCGITRHGVRVRARFLSAPYLALAEHAEVDEHGAFVRLGGRRWPVAPYAGTRGGGAARGVDPGRAPRP